MEQIKEISPSELKLKPGLGLIRILSADETGRRWLGIGLCAISGISYGFQALLAKLAYSNGGNVSTMLTLRFTIAALGVWGLVALLRPPLRQPRSTLLGLGFLGSLFVTNSLFFYLALQEMAAGTATLLVFSFPALVVVWSVLFFKERLKLARGVALVMALLGCALTIDPLAALASGQNFSWLGTLFALGSAFSNSFYVLLSGKFGRGVPGLVAAAWGVPITAGIFAAWGLLSGNFQANMTPLGWACCLAIGLMTAFSIGAFLTGIQLIGPSRASITATTEPATTVLISIFFLSEPASLIKLAGGALIIGAVILLSKPAEVGSPG